MNNQPYIGNFKDYLEHHNNPESPYYPGRPKPSGLIIPESNNMTYEPVPEYIDVGGDVFTYYTRFCDKLSNREKLLWKKEWDALNEIMCRQRVKRQRAKRQRAAERETERAINAAIQEAEQAERDANEHAETNLISNATNFVARMKAEGPPPTAVEVWAWQAAEVMWAEEAEAKRAEEITKAKKLAEEHALRDAAKAEGLERAARMKADADAEEVKMVARAKVQVAEHLRQQKIREERERELEKERQEKLMALEAKRDVLIAETATETPKPIRKTPALLTPAYIYSYIATIFILASFWMHAHSVNIPYLISMLISLFSK